MRPDTRTRLGEHSRRNARLLVAAAAVVSLVLFVVFAMWSIGHGGDWEDSERTQDLLAVSSEVPASVLIISTLDGDWLSDRAHWLEATGDYNIALGMGGCTTRPIMVVTGTPAEHGMSPPDFDDPQPVQPDFDDLDDLDVLAELDESVCFDTKRTVLEVAADGRSRLVERPNPTGPIWGYFMFAFSWVPFAAALLLTRRHGHTRPDLT